MIDLLIRIVDKILLVLAVALLAWVIYADISEAKSIRFEMNQKVQAAARLQQVIARNNSVWPVPPTDPANASEMVLGNWRNSPSVSAFHGYDFGM